MQGQIREFGCMSRSKSPRRVIIYNLAYVGSERTGNVVEDAMWFWTWRALSRQHPWSFCVCLVQTLAWPLASKVRLTKNMLIFLYYPSDQKALPTCLPHTWAWWLYQQDMYERHDVLRKTSGIMRYQGDWANCLYIWMRMLQYFDRSSEGDMNQSMSAPRWMVEKETETDLRTSNRYLVISLI